MSARVILVTKVTWYQLPKWMIHGDYVNGYYTSIKFTKTKMF